MLKLQSNNDLMETTGKYISHLPKNSTNPLERVVIITRGENPLIVCQGRNILI
jgi:hypothetical protein